MLRRRVRLRRADRCCRVRHPRRGRPTTARCGRRSRHPRLYGSTQRRGRERRRVEKLAVRQPLLVEVPEHVPYAFVREPRGATHYAVASRLRPLCNCSCPSPLQRRKAGDVACICRCHREGPRSMPAGCQPSRGASSRGPRAACARPATRSPARDPRRTFPNRPRCAAPPRARSEGAGRTGVRSPRVAPSSAITLVVWYTGQVPDGYAFGAATELKIRLRGAATDRRML